MNETAYIQETRQADNSRPAPVHVATSLRHSHFPIHGASGAPVKVDTHARTRNYHRTFNYSTLHAAPDPRRGSAYRREEDEAHTEDAKTLM